jgi:hypothetical protein
LSATSRFKVSSSQAGSTAPTPVVKGAAPTCSVRSKNLARYALPDGVEVHIEVAGTPARRQMLGDPPQQRFKFAGSG